MGYLLHYVISFTVIFFQVILYLIWTVQRRRNKSLLTLSSAAHPTRTIINFSKIIYCISLITASCCARCSVIKHILNETNTVPAFLEPMVSWAIQKNKCLVPVCCHCVWMHPGESLDSQEVPQRPARNASETEHAQLQILHSCFNRTIPCVSTFLFHIFEFFLRFLFGKKCVFQFKNHETTILCDRCFNRGNAQEYGNSQGGPNTVGIGEASWGK